MAEKPVPYSERRKETGSYLRECKRKLVDSNKANCLRNGESYHMTALMKRVIRPTLVS
jgi:hypothetical protein